MWFVVSAFYHLIMFIFKLSIKCCQNMFIKLQHTKTHCHQYPKLHFAKIGIETLSPPSSTRNIMFICFYATSSCLCHLYSFLLHLWRFCMMYGIWPSVLSSRIENIRLSSLGDSKCWETCLIFIFIFLWCHENGYLKVLVFDILVMCTPDLCIWWCSSDEVKPKHSQIERLNSFCQNSVYINQPLRTCTNS